MTVPLALVVLLTAGALAVARVSSEKKARPAEDIGTTAHDVHAVHQHLAVLKDNNADPEATRVSRDALLAALGGGYEPELRLEMVKAIFFRVDVEYHSLLIAHLEDIKTEAEETGNDGLLQKAEQLIATLERLDNPTEE